MSGSGDFFQRVVVAGALVWRTSTGHWEMAGPVAAYLAGQSALTSRVAKQAASWYWAEGDPLAALFASQGRSGSALAALGRARAMLEGFGLSASEVLRRAETANTR
ncbi:MAG TPA: hypothetical protein VME20_00245 [Acidimicrobiales bacterium]|nr:hypothetical protein [Acidimicrobiales bacterium]